MVVRVSTKEAERPEEDEDYQLRSDLKSVARTMLEGKPLLVEDAQEAQEEMERERFFGRIAVLGLGVRFLVKCEQVATEEMAWSIPTSLLTSSNCKGVDVCRQC